MGFTTRSDPNALDPWYPGDAHCDAVGFDCYYRSTIPVFRTTTGVFAAPLAFATARGKPLVIGEHAVGADFTDAQWTSFVQGSIATLDVPGVAAVTWFETNKTDGDYRLVNHSAAQAEWSSVASR
jgi:hypothetical protein